jgi:hypothetical protein
LSSGVFVAAVQDINSNLLVGDTSTVTLTLSHDTFANGQTTVSTQAVNGMATFSNLVINVPGSYILRATDSNPNLDPGFEVPDFPPEEWGRARGGEPPG